ncbi:sporulation membrane protein YtaF [Desulfosporosinus sp. Sb-LF]|uniref:sporulation membrane protein YtaF n=1 Tax=Desulfosporosinus sp. Sb-LF TaxID=2560027 RepID=UPI00130531DC|nr:sporulation membrane protein YtaF [Desulfosporosinus sp. Sb-LF]
MHIVSALFLGLAANLDNLGVGISYGVKKIRVPFLSNFFIALLSGVVVAISVLTGHLLSRYIAVAGEIGALIIVAIGFWVIAHKTSTSDCLPAAIPVMKTYSVPIKALNCVVQITKEPSVADFDANGFISTKEAMVLGLTLSFNCIATGVGAGLTGMDPLSSGISVFIFSMISISVGYLIGWKTASDRFEQFAQVISGVVLIIIGIYELLN